MDRLASMAVFLKAADLGSFTGSYTSSSVPSHGVVMLKVVSTP